MSSNKILDTALSIIDKHIHLDHKEIARKIYAETGYCDQDYNKFIAVITSGSLTLRDYIRKRRLFFAANELINAPEKAIAEIALEYGYSEQTSFARAIKKEYGKTPAEIRKSKESIPDVRKMLEYHLSNGSRLDSILERFESDNLSNSDWNYFENFINATDEFGFDTSTCCLISELSEKLSIPFGYLIRQLFETAIDFQQNNTCQEDEIEEFMRDLHIETEDELKELCQHYNCKWYELDFTKVKIFQLGIISETDFGNIWNFYGVQWNGISNFPLTKQMVQDYYKKNN